MAVVRSNLRVDDVAEEGLLCYADFYSLQSSATVKRSLTPLLRTPKGRFGTWSYHFGRSRTRARSSNET
jgi:hypothetical protein